VHSELMIILLEVQRQIFIVYSNGSHLLTVWNACFIVIVQTTTG